MENPIFEFGFSHLFRLGPCTMAMLNNQRVTKTNRLRCLEIFHVDIRVGSMIQALMGWTKHSKRPWEFRLRNHAYPFVGLNSCPPLKFGWLALIQLVWSVGIVNYIKLDPRSKMLGMVIFLYGVKYGKPTGDTQNIYQTQTLWFIIIDFR